MKSITHIVHLADIHIGSSTDRSIEYRHVFDKLFSTIAECRPTSTLIVIAGDVFHYKTKYSGEDVDDFHYLMKGLSAYPTIIIPGNHDDNVRNPSRIDLITPLITGYPNIIYRKESGAFTVRGQRFYHISIIDSEKLTTDEIQQTIEAAQYPILLFHGAINGTKYNNHTVSGSKITAQTISLTRLLLAGDIHQHQFITPNAAYSGSLIQQNIAEDRNKGYIIWDLQNNNGRFVTLENDHGFIRVDLRGQTVQQTAAALETISRTRPEHLRKVSIITDAPEEVARVQAEQVKAITGRLDRVKRVETHPTIINPSADVVEALTDLVRKSGATEDQLAAIIELHISKTVAYESRRWHITRLAFDYMFKYGKGNVIDFTKLTGISGVIAANCAGKTSIIDVLVFGLYGENLRGDLKSVKRSGSDRMFVRVDFNVRGVDYYINRSYSKNKALVFLHKKEKDIWINISGGSIDVTNNTIYNLIGTVKQFLATGLYYEAREDIFKLGSADRMKLLVELFGVIDNSQIIRDIKKTITATNKKISKLVEPRQGNHKSDLIAIDAQLAEQQILRAQLADDLSNMDISMNNIRARIIKLRPVEQVTSDITTVEQSLTTARRTLSSIRIEQEVAHAEIVIIEPSKRLELQSRCDSSLPSCDHLTKEIERLRIMLPSPPEMTAAQLAEGPALEKRLKTLTETLLGFPSQTPVAQYEDVNDLMQQLQHLKLRPEVTWISTLQTQYDKLSAKLQQIQLGAPEQQHEDIELLEKELDKLVMRPINNDVEFLQAQVNKLRSSSALQFEFTCKSCAHNKNILGADLEQAEGRLRAAEQSAHSTQLENSIVAERRQTLIKRINHARHIMHKNDEYRRLERERSGIIEDLSQVESKLSEAKQLDIETKQFNKNTSAEICKIKSRVEKARQIINLNKDIELTKANIINISNSLASIRQANIVNTERTTVLKRLALLEKQLEKARESEFAGKLLSRSYLYEQYQLCKRRDVLLADISAAERRLSALQQEREQIIACIPLVKQLEELGAKRRQLADQREAIIELIGRLTDRQSTTAKEIAIHDEYWSTYPALKTELDKYKLYVECLESPTLMTSIIAKNMPKIIDRCNDNLSTAASFRLAYNITETKIEFYIEDQITHVRSPAALASGFQKFIMMIALRLAISMTTPIACDFIMIDEGFGCMDDENILKATDLFSLITGDYRFVFIISHKCELQNIITDPLYITSYNDIIVNGQCSKVNNMIEIEELPHDIKRPVIGYPIGVPMITLGPAENTPVELEQECGGGINYPSDSQAVAIDDTLIVNGKKMTKCKCGIVVRREYLKEHMKRNKHKDRMKTLGIDE